MSLSWQVYLKACSTSMLGNTVRFRGRTTPDKKPSAIIFCKTFFNSGLELIAFSNVTPWKLVSLKNVFMPWVGNQWQMQLMTEKLTMVNEHKKAHHSLSMAFYCLSVWCFCHWHHYYLISRVFLTQNSLSLLPYQYGVFLSTKHYSSQQLQ
jgi:hypothetical protein